MQTCIDTLENSLAASYTTEHGVNNSLIDTPQNQFVTWHSHKDLSADITEALFIIAERWKL